MHWVIWGLVAGLVALVALWGGVAWQGLAAVERMGAVLVETAPGPLRRDLPPVVAAFAQRGLAGDTRLARAIRITQDVGFRQARSGPFQALSAQQTIGVGAPGFLWIAERRIGPLPLLRVVDSSVDGRGWLGVRLLGAIPVADATGPEIDRAEAMRYLAELPWAPDAILSAAPLQWRVQDDHAVQVAMETAGGRAAVTLHFDAAGDVTRITARNRPAETGADGRVVLRDWEGHFGDYAEIGGRRVPRQAEVGYLYEDGYSAYFRGRVTGLAPLR